MEGHMHEHGGNHLGRSHAGTWRKAIMEGHMHEHGGSHHGRLHAWKVTCINMFFLYIGVSFTMFDVGGEWCVQW